MKKLKYEKPISVDAGKVAAVMGLRCSQGSSADENCATGIGAQPGCTSGQDPNFQSVCSPTGSNASNNCQAGDSAALLCYPGSAAVVFCSVGSGD